ncbi:hypothetical protein [Hoeflea sp.]|uniref:hypothetical protein n=1 Tax=Hoeflea sp. TaxID=1940281 RepID=UPI003A91B150
MDWDLAIKTNSAALRRIIASLFTLAGLDATATPGSAQAPATLPRHLHSAVLRILRPAESALRRLIIVVARDVVLSGAERDHISNPSLTLPGHPTRTGIFLHGRPARAEDLKPPRRPCGNKAAPGLRSFALLDPLKRFAPDRPHPSQWQPRIVIDLDRGMPVTAPEPTPVSEDDPVSAAQLCRRLSAFRAALDDLPAQARRLARWRLRRSLGSVRIRRVSPLRSGLPPGHRQPQDHEVDMVLFRCHGLAVDLAMRCDTS